MSDNSVKDHIYIRGRRDSLFTLQEKLKKIVDVEDWIMDLVSESIKIEEDKLIRIENDVLRKAGL